MLVSVLASGSEGNCTYVETDDTKFLIDIGMNNKYITDRLKELGVDSKDIDFIFITHTHKDHTSALSTFIKKNNPTVVITNGMYNELKDVLKDYEKILFKEDIIEIGKTTVETIKTSHDAIDSRGYLVTDQVSSLVYITDTGYLNQKFFSKLYNKTMYILEANHDVEMLINGPYPKWLKSRILSDKGHLSNNSAGFYLTKLIGPKSKKVILAHLSHQNNSPTEALKTVHKTLQEYDIVFEDISVAEQRCTAKGVKI